MSFSQAGTVLCTVYVSDASRGAFISSLKALVGRSLVHSFPDLEYNRTSFYLMDSSGSRLQDSALRICEAAISDIDFSAHTGKHPTLGTVDNIVFSPLGEESILSAKDIACSFASRLNTLPNGPPVYFYGAASPLSAALKDIRRKLGYFTTEPSSSADYTLAADLPAASSTDIMRVGVSCVGAVPLILNLNFRCRPEDKRSSVVELTKRVRVQNLVEALTLPHENGSYEVACNLRNPATHGVDLVLGCAQRAATEVGVEIVHYYTTGPTETELLKMHQTLYHSEQEG